MSMTQPNPTAINQEVERKAEKTQEQIMTQGVSGNSFRAGKHAEVTLRNFTKKDIVVGIMIPTEKKPKMYSLPSRSKRKIAIAPGKYEWAANAEATPVKKGTKLFAFGQSYLWDFNLD